MQIPELHLAILRTIRAWQYEPWYCPHLGGPPLPANASEAQLADAACPRSPMKSVPEFLIQEALLEPVDHAVFEATLTWLVDMGLVKKGRWGMLDNGVPRNVLIESNMQEQGMEEFIPRKAEFFLPDGKRFRRLRVELKWPEEAGWTLYWPPPHPTTIEPPQPVEVQVVVYEDEKLVACGHPGLSSFYAITKAGQEVLLEAEVVGVSPSTGVHPDGKGDASAASRPGIDQSVHFHVSVNAQVLQTGPSARAKIQTEQPGEPGRSEDPAYLDALKIISTVSPADVENVEMPLTDSEDQVRRTFERLLGESFHAKDSGVECCDLFTLQGTHEGKQCTVAAMFKGSGNKAIKWPLKVAGCGKNGDQVVKLFEVPADVYIVQANGPFDANLLKLIQDIADAHARRRDRRVPYILIDGVTTARILQAADAKLA